MINVNKGLEVGNPDAVLSCYKQFHNQSISALYTGLIEIPFHLNS